MATQQVGINLKFCADTSQVKVSLQDLKNTLSEIASTPVGFDSSSLVTAKQAALDLKNHLQIATNINTGKLDLNKFSQSLKSSNQNLAQLRSDLLNAGTVGQQAFLQLAYNINSADNSMLSLGTKMREFGTTLKNTAKWQISSSILHGFMGALQQAYGYAQDLNKSLTDIRIVTGYSSERMADFAIEANKAAKALSVTTTEYTKASLIYYQQGLSGSEIQERTDTTIRMANAIGQSVEIVSDQMTAIWNNFDDGSKSLEYYADVMTALGAATASSTDEIAEGLEKFAAVSETVGLSYEYATTALATVTSATRQSADVVGTAFKTIFARIQGLELGETLEDGTDLNQYSQALMAVGVNIKTVNGELKDMDTILNEMARVWETLNKDEQVALAQKVAGVRQYNQLIALMENWDAFEINLETAKESEGTLKQQAQIYEESWKAASKRVKASMETVYDQLLDDEGFVKLLDGVSKFIDGIGLMIDGMGGLKGVIMLISSIFMSTFAKEIPNVLSKLSTNFNVLTGKAQKTKQAMMEENNQTIQNMVVPESADKGYQAQIFSIKKISQLQVELEKSRKKLSQAEIEAYELKIKQAQASGKYAEALGQEINQMEKAEKLSIKKIAKSGVRNIKATKQEEFDAVLVERDELVEKREYLEKTAIKNKKGGTSKKRNQEIETLNQEINILDQKLKELDPSKLDFSKETQITIKILERYRDLIQDSEWEAQIGPEIKKDLEETEKEFIEAAEAIEKFNEENLKSGKSDNTKNIEQLNKKTDILKKSMLDYVNKIKNKNMLPAGIKKELDNFEKEIKDEAMSADELAKKFQEVSKKINKSLSSVESEELEKEIEDLREELVKLRGVDPKAIDDLTEQFRSGAISAQEFKRRLQEINDTEIEPPEHNVAKFSEKLVNLGNTLMQVSMAYSSLQQLGDIWSQDDLSLVERIYQSFGALATILPIVTTALNSNAGASIVNFAASKLLKKARDDETISISNNTTAEIINTVVKEISAIKTYLLIGAILLFTAVIALATIAIANFVEKMIKGDKISTKNCDTLIENAEKTKELAVANEELSNSIETLIEDYEKMSVLGEDTTDVLSQMKDEMPELIDSYEKLAAQVGYSVEKIKELEAIGNLAFLTGDFSTFTELKDQIDKDLADLVVKDAKIGSVNASTKLAAEMQDVHSVKNTGSEVEFTLGGTEGINLFTGKQVGATNDETEALRILKKEMGDYYKKADGLFTKGAKLTASWKNPVELVDYYEKMVKARDEMLDEMSEEQLAESDTFRELNEIINETSEAYDSAKEQVEEYIEVAGKALMTKFDEDFEKVDSMEEFLAIRKEYLKVATTQYDLSDEQALAYLNEAAALSEVGNQYQLATIMAEQFNGISIDSAQYANVSDEYYQQLSSIFGEFTDTELQVAISVVSSSKDLEEFTEKFKLTLLETNEAVYRLSADVAKKTLTEAAENGTMNLSSLLANDEFIKYLEENNMSQLELTSKTYEQQYSIVSQYYSYVNKQVSDSIELQEEAYTARIAQMQVELALMQQTNRERGADIAAAKNEYAKKQQEIEDAKTNGATTQELTDLNAELDEMARKFEEDFEFEIDTNISEVQSELDQLFEKLNELQDKKIDMAMDWSGVDEVEGGMKKIADFSKTMQKDVKKVGNSYQLTAAQAREWLEFYPELANIATVTNDGIVEMNAAEVDAFIAGKDSELDAAIDTEIQRLEAEKTTLQADLEMKKKELIAAEKIATGEMDLEEVSAQYIVDLRKNLTDYFIETKADEAEAARLALETMSLNEEQYSDLVAEASLKNAQNISTSAEDGANAQADALSQIAEKWRSFGSYLIINIGPIIKDLIAAAIDPNKTWSDVFAEVWDESTKNIKVEASDNIYEGINNTDSYKTLNDFDKKAVYEEASRKQVDTINSAIKELEDGINSISGQQDYLIALKNQNLSEYGETSINDENEKNDGKKKKLDEEAERYHEINEELDDLNRNLDKISKEKDKAFGKKKIALMDQEIAATEDLIDATQRYIDQVQTKFDSDTARLNAFGAKYDAQGRIINYDEMYAQEIAAYNTAIDSGDEAIIEVAEKRYEDFQKVLKNYEDSLNTLEEQEDQLQEYVDQIAEMKLAKIEYQIELKIELNQADLDRIDYQLSMLGDDAFQEAEQLALLEQKAAHYEAQGNAYASGVETLLKDKGLSNSDINRAIAGDLSVLEGKDFSDDEIALIQNSIKGMRDSNLALMELNQQIKETLPASFEAWNEKIDENLEKFSYYDSVGNHFKNIIDIVGQKPLGITPEFLKEMNLVQVTNKKNEIKALTSTLEDLEKEKTIVEEKLSKVTTDEDKKYWEDMLKQVQDREAEIQERIFASTEETLQQIADIYTQEIQNALDRFEEQVAGSFGALKKLQEAYDKQKTLNSQYVADYKKLYELNKLNRQLNEAINDTASIKNKKILQELQDEINQLQKDGNKLSEYDLEVLQKKYDLKLAEIALEDAQNAKSQVRLVRNLEGNYNYVYTADETEIDNAIQNYEDKLFALQDLNETYIEEMGATFIQAQQEMVNALSKIQLQDFESYADYKKAVDDTAAYYQERMNYYSSELQKGLDNNISLYENEYSEFSNYNDQKNASWDTFTNNFSETSLGQTLGLGYETMEQYQQDVNNAIYGGSPGEVGGLLGELYQGYQDWYTLTDGVLQQTGSSIDTFRGNVATALVGDDAESVKEILGEAGGDFEALQDAIDKAAGLDDSSGMRGTIKNLRDSVWGSVYGDEGLIDSSNDTKDAVQTLSEDASTDFSNLATAVESWQTRWNKAIQPAIDKTDEMIKKYDELIKALKEHQDIPNLEKTIRITTEYVNSSDYGGGNTSGGNTSGGNTSGGNTSGGNTSGGNTSKSQKPIKEYKITAFGTYDNGYAAVQLSNGRWYTSRAAGGRTSANSAIGDKVTTVLGGFDSYLDPNRIDKPKTTTKSKSHWYDDVNWSYFLGSGSFDTGGYTGAWGSEGKIAMLHEKEIVLNKEDTSNMLQAVGILREISTILDLQAGQASTAALTSSYFDRNSLLVNNTSNSPIEQNVQIYAEFPDATDHLELEQAFNNLINTASQYVNRKY